MPRKQTVGRLAYKLYNKVGATEREKERAIKIIEQTDVAALDEYGLFTRAEITFWNEYSSPYMRTEAFETFQKIILNNQLPHPLTVGACFFLGRCYELGFGADYNMSMAYAHYRLANRLNPQACLKDIARTRRILNSEPAKINKNTPKEYKYNGAVEVDDEWEYSKYLTEWGKEYESCKQSLKNSGFFYADDPDEINVDEIDMYCVNGVKRSDIDPEFQAYFSLDEDD